MPFLSPCSKAGWRWHFRLATLCIGALLLCWGAWQIGKVARSKGAARPILVVEDRYLNLGDIWEDKAYFCTLPFQNLADSDIVLERIFASCTCVTTDPRPVVVPAGQTAEISLKLDLTRTPSPPHGEIGHTTQTSSSVDGASGPAVRDFALHLIPQVRKLSDGSLHQETWIIRGRVRIAFSVVPHIVSFGDKVVRGLPSTPRTLTVTSHVNLKSLTAKCDPAKASVEVSRKAIDDRSYELQITPSQSLPAGPLAFHVTITAATEDGTLLPELPVAVEGTIVEEIQATPSTFILGACALGQTMHETVVLRSRRGTAFEVQGIEIGSEDLVVQPSGAALPELKQFDIRQRITHVGNQSNRVTFILRGQEGADVTVTVDVQYHGIHK